MVWDAFLFLQHVCHYHNHGFYNQNKCCSVPVYVLYAFAWKLFYAVGFLASLPIWLYTKAGANVTYVHSCNVFRLKLCFHDAKLIMFNFQIIKYFKKKLDS